MSMALAAIMDASEDEWRAYAERTIRLAMIDPNPDHRERRLEAATDYLRKAMICKQYAIEDRK